MMMNVKAVVRRSSFYYVKIFIQHFSLAKKIAVINEIAVKSKKHKNFKNPKKFTIYIQ